MKKKSETTKAKEGTVTFQQGATATEYFIIYDSHKGIKRRLHQKTKQWQLDITLPD